MSRSTPMQTLPAQSAGGAGIAPASQLAATVASRSTASRGPSCGSPTMNNTPTPARPAAGAATPGPWYVAQDGQGRICAKVPGFDARETVATVSGYVQFNNDANARLIAAAPELLAALEGLTNSMLEYKGAITDDWVLSLGMALRADKCLDIARDAIDKAKGAPHAQP